MTAATDAQKITLALALRMRVEGKRFDEIAETCGYSDAHNARTAITHAIARVVRQPAEELRQIEVMRLERIHEELWLIFMDPTVKLSDRLAVVDRVVRISERRSKLMGLDVPSEVDTFDFAYRMAKKHGKSDEQANEIASQAVLIANEAEGAQHFQLTSGEQREPEIITPAPNSA